MSACPSEMQLHLMVQNTKYDYIPRPWNSASIAINWPIVPSIIPARGLRRRKRPPPTADCKSHPEKTIFRFSREKGFPKSEK